jgi:hypothetical protein
LLLGVIFDGLRRTAVAVAFTQHGIHGAAHDLGVFGFDVLLLVGLRIFGQIGQFVAFGLKFGDGGLELRHGRGDVRELDDVRGRLQAEFAEVAQIILLLAELEAKMRPAREMSRVSTSMPDALVKALTMGSSEYVARSGASSVRCRR